MDDSGIQEMRESTPMQIAEDFPHGNKAKHKFLDSKTSSLQIAFPASPIMPIHSSTLNDSLVTSVETCKINKFVSNFYNDTKSTPETPTQPSEFFKNHQECMQRTPSKHSVSSIKLGSPERNEIINGRKPTAPKWFTPPRSERNTTPKKRLFDLHHTNSGGVTKNKSLLSQHKKHDPVVYFMCKRNVASVVKNVFGSLNDVDLHACTKVSQKWREAVDSFPSFRRRVHEFAQNLEVNKENSKQVKYLKKQPSDNRTSTGFGLNCDKFIQLAQTLNDNQSLQKCPSCQQPQIVEYDIAQCQNLNCGYIYCRKCNSSSSDGPENFVDKCNSGTFEIHRQRRTLMDSPPPSQSQLSFLSSSTASNSHLYFACDSKDEKDSCYGTDDSDLPGYFGQDASSDNSRKSRKSFTVINSEETNLKRQPRRVSLYMPVVPIAQSSKAKPVCVEDSPVKDYSGAGSARSKRNLRRLLK